MNNPQTVIAKIAKYVLLSGSLAVFIALALSSPARAAGTATLTLTPSSGSYVYGSNVNVTIYEDSGSEAVNAIEADLSYDQSKLQFGSSSVNTSTFDVSIPHNNGSGKVMLSLAKFNGSVTGRQLVGTISFTALASSGSTTLRFDLKDPNGNYSTGISRASDATNLWDQVLDVATFSFTAAASGTGGTTGGSTTGSKTTTPTTQPKAGSGTTAGTPAPANPTPSQTSTATTSGQGYFVAIKVTDPNDKPVVGAQVTAATYTVKTDAYGIANFENLPPGPVAITVKANGKTVKETINVSAGAQAQDVQSFNVRVAGVSTLGGRWYLYLFGLLLFGLILGGGLSLKKLVFSHHQVAMAQNGAKTNVTTVQSAVPVEPPPPPAPNPAAAPKTKSGMAPQIFYPDPTVKPPTLGDDDGKT